MIRAQTTFLKSHPGVLRRKLTVTEYYRMDEVGILTPDDRVELIEGEILKMSPVSSPHLGTVNLLNRYLTVAMAERAVVSVQNPLRLDEFSEPEPDLTVLKPRKDGYRSASPKPQDVLLLIEVAASSLSFDRAVKVPLYAYHDIAELWIVDLNAEAVEVFRDPAGDSYGSVTIVRDDGLLRPVNLPDVSIRASDLFLGSDSSPRKD